MALPKGKVGMMQMECEYLAGSKYFFAVVQFRAVIRFRML